MYADVYMSGKPLNKIMEEIFLILKKEKELSLRQLAIKTGSQWITVKKATDSLKVLKVVKEREGTATNRKERLFSLK